jgi:hypothetical protein
MMSQTQTLEGITSLLSDGKHIIMWDLDTGHTLKEIEAVLRWIQQKYNLSHIYIASDAIGSYRAWCFSRVDLKIFLSILVDSLDILDYSFFYYTVKRRKATLRTDRKRDRPFQEVVSFLPSYFTPYPTKAERVVYDTGLEKRGHTILLGERDG